MKTGIFQRHGSTLHPFDPESAEIIKEFYENQPIRVKMSGIKKPRSYQQLKMYWKLCEIVAENKNEFADKYDVDWQIRVDLKHIGRMTVQGNKVIVECKSISFSELDHIEACNYFDRAFDLMAKWLNVSRDELIQAVGEFTQECEQSPYG